MIKELIIHAGDCKTGSTSIQKVLGAGAWSSPGLSACYPAALNHNPLARAMRGEGEGRDHKAILARIRHQLLASDADIGIISAEDFEYVDPSLLRVAIDNHLPEFKDRLRIIAYIRPHHERLVSAFAERCKQTARIGSMEDLHDAFVAEDHLMYAPRLEGWKAAFGDAYHVRPMIRSKLVAQDVVADFFDFALDGAPVVIEMEREANSSLSLEDLVMLRELHKAIRTENPNLVAEQRTMGWNLAEFLLANQRGKATRLQIHKSLARKVVETYRADAARVDALFMNGTPLTGALAGAVEKALDEPQSMDIADHYLPRTIGQIHAMGQFIHRMMEADPKKFAMMARDPMLKKRRAAMTDKSNAGDGAGPKGGKRKAAMKGKGRGSGVGGPGVGGSGGAGATKRKRPADSAPDS